ncbi:CDP-glucose 4,6-dehydratase [Alphaproteobacteria bacterium]|nr:CDP-glucose 4,6-dehydratase [Alphaproteobacteria bacterium]
MNKSFWKNKKILITGHTGFKGTWLSLILLLFGAKIIGISLKLTKKNLFFKKLNIENKIKNYFVDISNLKNLKRIIIKEKPEFIFHLAAQSLVSEGFADPINTFRTNVSGTANLMESIRDLDFVKVAIVVTSDKVYRINHDKKFFVESDELGGDDPYSSSKACQELIVHSFLKSYFFNKKNNPIIATVRSGNVLGGGDFSENRIFPDIIRSIVNSDKLIIRNQKSIRPWQHVLDPLNGYLKLAQILYKQKKNHINYFNFNFGPNYSSFKTVKQLVDKVRHISDYKFDYKINMQIFKKFKETDVLLLNSNKSKALLNWKPKLNFDQSIKITYDWYETFINHNNDKKLIYEITKKQILKFFV